MPTNFATVPDNPDLILVLAEPPNGSVTSALVQQFIRENRSWNQRHCIHALARIPADKWPMISTLLTTISSDHRDFTIIQTLSQTPVGLLPLMIDFTRQHKITNGEALYALSAVKIEEFHAMTQLIATHDLVQMPKIWRALAAMPAEYRSQFIDFCKSRQYHVKGLPHSFIFQHHTPTSWEEIDNFLQDTSNYGVLEEVANMSAEAGLAYIRFISTNNVQAWDARAVLVDIAHALRQPIWDFICKHQLQPHVFKNFPENERMWARVSRFIEHHMPPKPSNEAITAEEIPDSATDQLLMLRRIMGVFAETSKDRLSNDTITALLEISDEDWPEFERFLDECNIHEFEKIAKYATVPARRRNDLFDFCQKYQIKSYEISTFSHIPIEHWPSFITLIEKHQFTDKNTLSAIAERAPEEWEACADLIINRPLSKFCLAQIGRISPQHFHFLCIFAKEYRIDDGQVIHGLALIPSVRQWENIYRLAQPLFAPPLFEENRGYLMQTLYEITKQEYRIDRIMPTYDENERLARIAVLQARINAGLMPQDAREYYEQMTEILKTPAEHFGNMHQAAVGHANAISVHAEGREGGTGHALRQLLALPYDKKHIDTDYAEFITCLNDFPSEFTRTSAQFVLGLAASQADGFGPLSADTLITSHNLNITGKEFLARCWHFIQHGEFMGMTNADALAKDRDNARVGLIKSLADAYEEGAVICNPGKLQHIAVSILQGRLEGVHIDQEVPIATQEIPNETTLNTAQQAALVTKIVAASLKQFLLQYEPTVHSQIELKSHVDDWLKAERGLSGETYQQYCDNFRKDLDTYLEYSDLPKEPDITMADEAEHLRASSTTSPLAKTDEKAPPVTTTQPLKNNYTQLLHVLAKNIESGNKPRWTSGGSDSQKVQVLRALADFVNNQGENWIMSADHQIRLLSLIKSICHTHRNWAPIHFGSPASLGEFLTLIKNSPEAYQTTAEKVNTLDTTALSSKQLHDAISTVDFNTLLGAMPVECPHKNGL